MVKDYRSGKYYKPWKSSQKVVIVSSKKHIMELSEASELSQRAIYADLTIMQNMTELTEDSQDYWTPDYLAQALLGIWFAASHQPWMNLDFVVLELCSHPEYIQLLREEIGNFSDLTYSSLESFPILDSFIKETVRLNPLDTRKYPQKRTEYGAIRRKAMSPFRFSDGPYVPAGAMACVSSFDLMHEPESYPDPYTFNGQRFVSCTSDMKGTKFTDISEKFPVWGYGSLACPGRFHASLVMKLVIAHLVSNFDMRLENEKENVRWMWETFTMPYEKTRILMRERKF
ncbi:hypothetical protein NHQ30_010677 [Ciborinia camelliae]|nr:hypothetical protein NHQ30_010677 [Ciborinia camelliae]